MDTPEKKKALFETMPVSQAVTRLAVPNVLASLVSIIYSLSDTYFVGMLNRPVENAAVTLAAPMLLAFNAVINLFGIGTSSLMSRAMGRQDSETARKSAVFGFYCALFFSFLFSLCSGLFSGPLMGLLGVDPSTEAATYQYLFWTVILGAVPAIMNAVLSCLVRAEGGSLHSSIGAMSGCLLNILLDPVFILPWGLDMGASGAGLATCLSNCFSLGYFFVLLAVKRGNTVVCIDPRRFRFSRHITREIFAVGIPACIQNLLNVTGMTVLNNAAAGFGSTAVAAMGITQRIASIPNQIAMSMPSGSMPIVGYNYASGNRQRMKAAVMFTLKLMGAVLVPMLILLLLFPEFTVSLFMADGEIIRIGGRMLRGFSLGVAFMCADFLAVNIFMAVGKGAYALLFAILRKIVLEIPAILILNALFPLYGLAYSQLAAELVMSVLAAVFIRRLLSGKEKPGRRLFYHMIHKKT